MSIEEWLMLILFLLILLLFLVAWLWRGRRQGSSNVLQVGSYTVDRHCDPAEDTSDFFCIHHNGTASAQTLTLVVTNTGNCEINLFSQPGRQMPASNIGLAPPAGSGSVTVSVPANSYLFFNFTCSSAEPKTSPCTGTITTNLHL